MLLALKLNHTSTCENNLKEAIWTIILKTMAKIELQCKRTLIFVLHLIS